MAASKLRSRHVLFRLTQDEYNRLRAACSANNSPSISAFARSKLLDSLTASSPSLNRMDEKLDELQATINQLRRALLKS